MRCTLQILRGGWLALAGGRAKWDPPLVSGGSRGERCVAWDPVGRDAWHGIPWGEMRGMGSRGERCVAWDPVGRDVWHEIPWGEMRGMGSRGESGIWHGIPGERDVAWDPVGRVGYGMGSLGRGVWHGIPWGEWDVAWDP